MTSTTSTYTIEDIDNFLKTLYVHEESLILAIREGWNNLQSLKMAAEIYQLRAATKSTHNIDFSSKNLVEMACTENISNVCAILKIAAKIQRTEQFYDAVQYVKNLNFNNNQKLLIYLQILSVFIKLDGDHAFLDHSFIISVYKAVLAQNLSKEKNYFIANILKPYIIKNLSAKDIIVNKIITSLDLYTILCIIPEVPPAKFTDSFWIHIQDVITNKDSQWEYKLALNILKTFVNILKINSFNVISNIIKGLTENILQFQNEWQQFFVLMEIAEEKQLHLVQPSLILLKNIGKLHPVWIQCIYKQLLNHMQLSVAYNTAIAILHNDYGNINHYREYLQCLFAGINKNDYSEYAISFFQKLNIYTNHIEKCHYDILLEEGTRVHWAPLAAWLFYSNCLPRLRDTHPNSIKLEFVQQIMNNLGNIPHKYIRDGCFDLFYNIVINSNISIICDKLELLEMFKSHNTGYIEAFSATHAQEISLANVAFRTSETIKFKTSNFKSDDLVQDCIEILLNPHYYDESKVSVAYYTYNTYQDSKYSKNVLNFWTLKALNERVSSDICAMYITHLCSYIEENPDDALAEKIEQILCNVFVTQHENVSIVIYENLSSLLKPFTTEYCKLERILSDTYRQLKNFKQNDVRKRCSMFYFKTFFTYCDDNFDMEGQASWSSMHDEIIQEEVMAFTWLSNMPRHLEMRLLPYVLKLLYFGDCYTKHRRYEDVICHQIFLAGGVLTGRIEASLETQIRLKSLQICANLKACPSKFWDVLLDLPHKRYFPDSSDHLRCLRTVQTILILMKDTQFQCRSVLDKILWHLCEANHQPSVRQIMQWILIKLCLANSEYLDVLIEKFKSSTSVSALTSTILILYHVSLGKSDDFVEKAIEAMLHHTTGAVFKLRVYSQVSVLKLIDKRKMEDEKYKLLHKLLKKTIEENEESSNKVLQTDREFFEVFHPELNYHLRTILVDIPKMNNVVSAEWQYIDFNLNKYQDFEKILPMDKNKKRLTILTRDSQKRGELQNIAPFTTNIQKKIVPLNMDNMESTTKTCTDLIVIASLVTSSANLGGLARTCEIYGVKKLVIRDSKIANDKEFKSLSMSSECWLDIVEVKIDNLIEYIVREKNNGYIALGAEQTCESVKLNTYKFPEKCIILLGNEKEGVPPHLLPYLDTCVEIPQFGVIRSLNVHVAGSTFIWEYIRQRMK